RWIMSVSESGDKQLQENLLLLLKPALAALNKDNQTKEVDNTSKAIWPSKLLVRTAFKLGKVNFTYTVTPETPSIIGKALGKEIASSYSKIRENQKQLEEPSSYKAYCDALPGPLCNFFQAFLTELQKRKLTSINRMRKTRNLPSKVIDTDQITRTTTLFVSMILTIAFPGMKIWLTHIMSSICQKPKLLPYLRQILYGAKVISYSKRHENRLELERAHNADPVSRILQGTQHINMFNLAVIDNIDFAALTFKSGNIFDTPRQTSHATLRLLIQFTLPNAPDDIMEESIDQPLI
ncbi:7831_t:CDS:1, partial [Paraglomus occultum]